MRLYIAINELGTAQFEPTTSSRGVRKSLRQRAFNSLTLESPSLSPSPPHQLELVIS